jgi:hypothetical protein
MADGRLRCGPLETWAEQTAASFRLRLVPAERFLLRSVTRRGPGALEAHLWRAGAIWSHPGADQDQRGRDIGQN